MKQLLYQKAITDVEEMECECTKQACQFESTHAVTDEEAILTAKYRVCSSNIVFSLYYEGCSLRDVRWSLKQEVAVRFTNNVHIPSKYSPPLCTHGSSRLNKYSAF